MVKKFEKITLAKELRKKGYSFGEIAEKLNISKSTVFLWTKAILLGLTAKERIRDRERIGIIKAKKTLRNKRQKNLRFIQNKAKSAVTKFRLSINLSKILCSILYWAEGSKINRTRVIFTNSDPKLIRVFLKLFRKAFPVDKSKFRALVHIHEYHNEIMIKKYWSNISKIPLQQFNESYLKPHTKKRIRNDYQGTLSIRYYDYRIAQEIGFLYNVLATKILGA